MYGGHYYLQNAENRLVSTSCDLSVCYLCTLHPNTNTLPSFIKVSIIRPRIQRCQPNITRVSSSPSIKPVHCHINIAISYGRVGVHIISIHVSNISISIHDKLTHDMSQQNAKPTESSTVHNVHNRQAMLDSM